MHKGGMCKFLFGQHTEPDGVNRFSEALRSNLIDQVELLLYKANSISDSLINSTTNFYSCHSKFYKLLSQ